MIALGENRYGKSRVRVMKVNRDGECHTVHEWNVEVWLKGDFESILPTDTMKNTVYFLARKSSAPTPEQFAIELVTYLLDNNPQVTEAGANIAAMPWTPLFAGGQKHNTAFMQMGQACDTVTVTYSRGHSVAVASGFKNLAILKTAKSGFTGYIKDKLTTLKETHDRLLGTLASGEWKYADTVVDYKAARFRIVDAVLNAFALHDSLSVQQTLYAMGKAALEAEPSISEIDLSMPNKHCNLVDLTPLGIDNPNQIFVPTDEPHGSIEARVRRTA
jgi:urate oxidase